MATHAAMPPSPVPAPPARATPAGRRAWRRLAWLALLALLLALLALPASPAGAEELKKPIDAVTVIKDSTDCGGAGWERIGTDLQLGSGALDPSRYYLCFHRGDGTPLTEVYPVVGIASESKNCDAGDTRFGGEHDLNKGSAQVDYLCYGTNGRYPLIGLDVTSALKPAPESDRWTLQRAHNNGRDFNFGYVLLYVYNRDLSQVDGMTNCGGEGEPICDFFSDFYWQNGSGHCDRGLRPELNGVCVNGWHDQARRHGAVTDYLNSATGQWVAWATANQRNQLAIDEPINWVLTIATHNAFNNYADGYHWDPNQRYSITDQLRLGARGIGLDVHEYNGRLRLCHRGEDKGVCSPTDRLYFSAIKEIAAGLREEDNKDEIIVINLEDPNPPIMETVNIDQLIAPIKAHFGAKVYKPGEWRAVLKHCPTCAADLAPPRWPTRRELLAAGKRVIILDDNDHEDGAVREWFWQASDYAGAATNFDDGPYAKDIDYANCSDPDNPNTHLWQADRYNWIYAGEDRTYFSGTYDWKGLIGTEDAASLARCNVTMINLDMIGSAAKTMPSICDDGRRRTVDVCDAVDTRVRKTIWSWNEGDAGAYGDRALLDGTFGVWRSKSATAELHHFACARPRDGDPNAWPDKRGESWKVTRGIGMGVQGGQVCQQEFGATGYVYAAPVNGYQHRQLLAALTAAKAGAGFNPASGSVWLNFRKDSDREGDDLTWRAGRRPSVWFTFVRVDGPESWRGENNLTLGVAGSDPDGRPLSLRLHYGDDQGYDGASPTGWGSGRGIQISRPYLDDGDFTITATVDNGQDSVNSVTTRVTIPGVAPWATFTVTEPASGASRTRSSGTTPADPLNVDEGVRLTLRLTDVDDAIKDRLAGFDYAYDCGNGGGYGDYTRAAEAVCVVDDNPIPWWIDVDRTVKAKLRDKDGDVREYPIPIRVRNVTPSATFEAGPVVREEGQPLTLRLTNPINPLKSGLTGLTYAFDCGQGFAGFSGANQLTCAAPSVGERTVRAAIRDTDGASREYAARLTIVPRGANTGTVDLCADYVYAGACRRVAGDIPALAAIGFDNVTSSIRVNGTMTVAVFADANYQGRCETFSGSDSFLKANPIGNDTISSVRFNARCADE